jgi:hypothetical protein
MLMPLMPLIRRRLSARQPAAIFATPPFRRMMPLFRLFAIAAAVFRYVSPTFSVSPDYARHARLMPPFSPQRHYYFRLRCRIAGAITLMPLMPFILIRHAAAMPLPGCPPLPLRHAAFRQLPPITISPRRLLIRLRH